jgi:putative ABC transport system permease protein
MLGVIIGVMAVTLVICIGQGLKEQIANQLGDLGKNVFTVTPGNGSASLSVLTGLSSASSSLLTGSDLGTIANTPGVNETVPIATASGAVTGDHTIKSPYIVATDSDFSDIIHEDFSSGSFFGPNDEGSVVLGASIAQKLFNDDTPLGQGLIWRGQRFIVTGVYDYFNAPPFSIEANFDNAIFMPYGAAEQASGGSLGIYRILGRSNTSSGTSHVIDAVRSALITAHGGANDVTVSSAIDSDGMSNQTLHLLAILVAGAAIIALIVSGVGIMDVMLVSVTERMHEIGLRKAIGATNRQILRQFIAEAFVLSAFGAIAGVALSAIAVGLLRAYTSIQAVLVWQAMVAAPVVAILVGVFFGTMPALKAARKDPIEALRHE